MATSSVPTLPVEIWTEIVAILLREEKRPFVAWTTYRQVCNFFRDAVDLSFQKKYLTKTSLNFCLGEQAIIPSAHHGGIGQKRLM